MEVASEISLPDIGSSLSTCIESKALLTLAQLNEDQYENKQTRLDLEKIIDYLKHSGQNWRNVREAIVELQKKYYHLRGDVPPIEPNAVDVTAAVPFILGCLLKQRAIDNKVTWVK